MPSTASADAARAPSPARTKRRREEPSSTCFTRASKSSPSIVPPRNDRKTDRKNAHVWGWEPFIPRPHLSACWELEDDIHHPHLGRVPVPHTACLSTSLSCAQASSLTTRSGRNSDAFRTHFGHISTSQLLQSLTQRGHARAATALTRRGRCRVWNPIAHMGAMTPKSWVMCASDQPCVMFPAGRPQAGKGRAGSRAGAGKARRS